MPNTINSNLLADSLSNAVLTVAGDRLAALRHFSRNFGTDPLAPRAKVQVRKVTNAGGAQTNPTNFETGDTTVDAVEVDVDQVSRSFHVTNDEMQSGHRVEHLAEINARVFAEAISDRWTGLLIADNYPSPLVVGAAGDFDKGDLSPILSAAKNFDAKNLVLDGGHLAYLLPTERTHFRRGEPGAYGFDILTEQNRWTDAEENTVGFVASPNAIAMASGMPADIPGGEFLVNAQVTLPGIDLVVAIYMWYARATRSFWASYDVMFGAAVGDAAQGRILVSAAGS